MGKSYWLLKTEPATFSFAQLLQDQRTNWNGVRNFQARNYLKQLALGDLAFIYHSGEERSVIGVAQVVREAYPDPDPKKPGDWVQVDLEPLHQFKNPVPLSVIKATSSLKDLLLIKQSRLSVMPVSASHYEIISKLGNASSLKAPQGSKAQGGRS